MTIYKEVNKRSDYMIHKYLAAFGVMFMFLLTGCSSSNENNEDNENPIKLSSESENFQFDDLMMMGKEDRIGFVKLNGDPEKLFVSEKGALYLWRFFGKESDFKGDLKLIGIKKSNKKEIILANSKEIIIDTYGGNQKGVEKSLKVGFPSPGVWEIKVYFGEKFFDSVSVEVLES
jgi:hypothetical protein